jgi:hypothetical protein
VSTERLGIIISNCQSQPLKHILSLMCRDLRFDGLGVHLIPPHKRNETVAQFVEETRGKYAVVLAVTLSDDFGPLSAARLRDTFAGSAVFTIPNFYFAGLHPDLTYMGGIGHRVRGPLGEYHSKLAVLGYMKGLSAEQTIDLFRDDVYRRLGYYDMYHESMVKLRRRDEWLDIPFTEELTRLLKEDFCFFSVNHPTSFLVSRFCDKAAGHFEAQGLARKVSWPRCVSAFPNHLAQSAIFPIYPEVAAAHGVPYDGSYIFKPQTFGDNPATCLDMPAFVRAEFDAFRALSPEMLMQVPQVREVVQQADPALKLSLADTAIKGQVMRPHGESATTQPEGAAY